MRSTTRDTVHRAKALRREMSLPEVLLWRFLRKAPLKFRRQHPLGPYIIDYYCPAAKLAIEIDGMAHAMGDRPTRDLARDVFISARGIEVLRIPARAVLASANEIAANIIAAAQTRL